MPDSFNERISKFSHVHRVYIIPTSIGFYFSFIAFVLFLIAISYGHNLAFFCTFLFFSFVSFSAVIANESIKKIELSPSEESVFIKPGVFSALTITVVNNSKRPQFDLNIESQGIKVGFIEELRPLEKKIIYLDLSLLNLSRGLYQLNRLTISTRFPLGLFYAWKYRPIKNTLVVAPMAQEGKVHLTSGALDFSSSFEQSSKHPGTDEYIEIRDHRRGEGFGRIDQKRSLKLGRPQVRTFSADSGISKSIILNTNDLELSLSRAAYYIEHHKPNESLSLIFPDGFKTLSSSGLQHHQYLLEQLSTFKKEKVLLN